MKFHYGRRAGNRFKHLHRANRNGAGCVAAVLRGEGGIPATKEGRHPTLRSLLEAAAVASGIAVAANVIMQYAKVPAALSHPAL